VLWTIADSAFAGTGFPNLNFEVAMEKEHCGSADSGEIFTTPNYNITTCPRKEWKFVVQGISDQIDMGHGRIVKSVDQLLKDHNSSLSTQNSKLARVEVTAVVLYTGPMVSRLAHALQDFQAALLTLPDRDSAVANTLSNKLRILGSRALSGSMQTLITRLSLLNQANYCIIC
jgi:hypothetical protein